MFYVYLLRCSNDTVYVGCTSDLGERLKRHNAKEVAATKLRLPVTLITHIAFTDKYKAFKFEKYLKGGSGRAFLNKRLV